MDKPNLKDFEYYRRKVSALQHKLTVEEIAEWNGMCNEHTSLSDLKTFTDKLEEKYND